MYAPPPGISAALLGERLSRRRYLGLAAACLGALIFAFHGSLADLMAFNPHAGFLWMPADWLTRSAYLVLIKKWDVHPALGEGLFVLLSLGTVMVLPFFLVNEVGMREPLDYGWAVWGSIAFIGMAWVPATAI